jgi:very-short-patch-repair endonuclease/lambda repressor-like predicted transcriptional regulator
MPRKLKNSIDVDTLVTEYLSGISVKKLAKRYECSRRAINKRLIAAGISIRNVSQANQLHSDSLTSAEKRRKAEAAHAAVRGKKVNLDVLETIALSKERSPIFSKYELMLYNELTTRGIHAVPQKAFSKFNVDFYIPERGIIVEIFGGWHDSPKAIKCFEDKSALLLGKGYSIIVCWSAGVFDAVKVCNYIESLTASKDARHYIIRGNARPSKIGLTKINFRL